MKIDFYKEARKIWDDLSPDDELEKLTFELKIHKKLLNIFQVGEFYYFVFNPKKGEFEFMSPGLKTVLGFDPETISASYFLSQLHPEDQPYFLNFETKIKQFFSELPFDKVEKYKIRYDFRIKNNEGQYIRILHQMVSIQHNDTGVFVRSLGIHTDISHLKEGGKPVLSFIGMGGEPSFINVEVENLFKPSKRILSEREMNVLILLVAGQKSPEIAQSLNIKKYTVDTHRKNILRKTNCLSSYELISKAINEGWL